MKNEDYYEAQMRLAAELVNQYSEKKVDHLKQILLVSATLLGIVISLHNTNYACHSNRYLFASGLALLSISTLLTLLALRIELRGFRRVQVAFLQELQKSLRSGRKMNGVSVPFDKLGVFCEKTANIFLIVSIALLSLYGILSALC